MVKYLRDWFTDGKNIPSFDVHVIGENICDAYMYVTIGIRAYLKAEVHSNKRAQIPVFETLFSAHEHYFHRISGVENELPLLFGPVLYVLILTRATCKPQ